MRKYLTLLLFIIISLKISGQSGTLQIIQPTTPCGCASVACGCNVGSGNCVTQTVSVTLTIPANSDATLTLSETACVACGSGPGWETNDCVSAPPFTGGCGDSSCPMTPNPFTASSCFSTTTSSSSVTISFTANRMDEILSYNLTFVNNNGTPNCAVLPIKISSFIAINVESTVILSLTTASETNNDYFTIERSGDGAAYEAIGEIKGAGNSSREISYEYTDEAPLRGVNYYRIRQTDFDGKYSYSEVRSVRFTDGASVTVSPRTTAGRIDITTDMEDYTVEVYTASGAQVQKHAAMNADQTIDIQDLKAGIYFLRVSSGAHSETVRVVKL